MRLELENNDTIKDNSVEKLENNNDNSSFDISKKSFSYKLKYFWDYYKVPVIIGLLVICVAAYIIHAVTSTKPSAFYALFLNSYGVDGYSFSKDFSEYADIDLSQYSCTIDGSLSISPVLESTFDMAASTTIDYLITDNNLDVMALDTRNFYCFCLHGYFDNLENVLTEEEMKKYEGRIYYFDMAELKEAEENADEFGLSVAKITDVPDDKLEEEAERHLHPENMAEPVPYGIFIGDAPYIQNCYCYSGKIPVIGIVGNSNRKNLAIKFIDFIFQD